MTLFVEMVQKRRLQQGFRAHQLLVVSSPRPHWFQLIALNLVSKAQRLTDVPYLGPVFGVSKTSMSGFVALGPHCALLKTCCRIGGRNHHSRHRAMIVCDTCMQRSAIVFLTPGQLAGQMHTPRLHFIQLQIWPQKRGQFPDLQFVPFPIEGWFWGPLIGLRNSASFSPFALSFGAQYIWSAWPQLQRRFSVGQTGFTTKTSTCSRYPCAIISYALNTATTTTSIYTHSIWTIASLWLGVAVAGYFTQMSSHRYHRFLRFVVAFRKIDKM